MMRLLAATVTVMALVAVPAQAKITCRSGVPYVDQPGVIIFEVEKRAGPYLYACTTKLSKPTLVYARSPATTGEISALARRGNRILLEIYEFADGGGGSALGWFDVRTGRKAFRELDNIGDADFGQTIRSAILGPDGSIAYVRDTVYDEEDGPNQHALFHIPFAKGKFAREKRITVVDPAGLDPDTIAFAGGGLTWRTRGADRSLAIPPDTSVRAPTLARPRRTHPARCRTEPGDGLYAEFLTDSQPVRLFRVTRGARKRRGIWACRYRRTDRPRFVMPATRTLDVFARTTKVVAFAARPRGGDGGIVGWFEPGAAASLQVRTATLKTEPYGTRKVVALAPDREHGLVVLSEAPGGYVLSFLRAFASGFDPEAQLAYLKAGEIAPHTLTASDGAIKWRTQGEQRSAPLS